MSTELVTERTIPAAAIARPATPEQAAKEIHNLPPDWKACIWERLGRPEASTGMLLTGAVMRETFKSGPRKGRVSWAKRDRATEAKIGISDPELKAWFARWEAETALCSECQGSRYTLKSWNRETGTKYRQCRKCDGSGMAKGRQP